MARRALGLVLCTFVHASSPFVVTDYLPSNREAAQAATKVDLSSEGWTHNNSMHSGLFSLDKKLGKETFFWYSAALDGNKDAPLLLWLQGGPGASSLFGLFTEVGPFLIDESGALQARATSWNEHYHMVFFDNPVGVGFSQTQSTDGFVRDEVQVGKDLYSALGQFFQLFPELRNNDFYVAGESYGGKYAPACGYTIHEENKKPGAHINFKGIVIIDGAFDAPNQLQGYGDILFNLGMADQAEKEVFDDYDRKINERLAAKDTVGAFEYFDEMLNGDFYPHPTYYANVTGMTSNYFNVQLAPDATPLGGAFVKWLNQAKIKSLIHVGERIYSPDNMTVEYYLKADWMRGVTDMLIPLMDNYKVMIVSGQNDLILGPVQTEKAIRNLDWTGKEAYGKAEKVIFTRSVKGPGSELPDVGGYLHQVNNFVQAVVRGAGHMVPGDQPERMRDLLDRYIAGHRFGDEVMAASQIPNIIV